MNGFATKNTMPKWLLALARKSENWVDAHARLFAVRTDATGVIDYASLKVHSEFLTLARLIAETATSQDQRAQFLGHIERMRPPIQHLLTTVRSFPQCFPIALCVAHEGWGPLGVKNLQTEFENDFALSWRERLPVEDLYIGRIFETNSAQKLSLLQSGMLRNAAFADRFPHQLNAETGYFITHGVFFATNWGRCLIDDKQMKKSQLAGALDASFGAWIAQHEYDLCFEVIATLIMIGRQDVTPRLIDLLVTFAPETLPRGRSYFPKGAPRYQALAARFNNLVQREFILTYHIALTIILATNVAQRSDEAR